MLIIQYVICNFCYVNIVCCTLMIRGQFVLMKSNLSKMRPHKWRCWKRGQVFRHNFISIPPIFRPFILYTNYRIRVIVVSFNRVVELFRNDMHNQQCRLTGKTVRLSTAGEINVLHVFPWLWIFVTIRPCNPCKRAHNSSV